MSENESVDPLASEILRYGLDGWIAMIDVQWILYAIPEIAIHNGPEEVREYALRVIRWLAENDYVEIGELGDDRDFHRWPGSVDEVLGKLGDIYTGKDETDAEWYPWGYACWFSNTAEGNALAVTLPQRDSW